MKPWLLKLRKVPLLGWLVGIIAVLIALLIWSVRHESLRERKLRVSMQISSTKRNHERAIEEVAQIDNIQRAKIKASQDIQVGKLEAKAVEIRVAEKESNKRLAEMVNAMFKK